VSLSRPVRLILVLATLALSLFACKPDDQEAVKRSAARPVRKHAGPLERQNTKYAPIVDVYVQGDRAVPDLEPIPVHARAGHAHGGEPVPSVINWFGPPTQKLKIQMKDATQPCLKEPTCEDNHCIAFTNVKFNNSKPAPCGYKVWIQDVTLPYDPVVIIDDCCAN
jgi:hypothetical protein